VGQEWRLPRGGLCPPSRSPTWQVRHHLLNGAHLP
jgi:hypothetical protein